MRIIIYQISEKSNIKRLSQDKETLIRKPYKKLDFDIRNYQITHINFKFWDIKRHLHEQILKQIEREFTSFYTFEARPENGIIVSDIVKIGQDLYYYNGNGNWLFLGKQPVQRY